ncbi:sel1 repeat family protein [Roseomonas sp. OT10]|uniref:tetratricopeptide repeat protein n=1 Tax=Roseomonas cutis TaxID=2897332 RepID=UPI001E354938|nr:tetratricopeptide repeat protein [Roseomonas sp. OT10]UFN50062.1 sel1 repeat family protein [Roseomonas sp. OT10]
MLRRPELGSLLLGLGLALGGCAQGRPGGFGPEVVVCRAGEACRAQPSGLNTAVLDGGEAQRQEDPNRYAGEDPAGLRAAAASGDPVAAYKLGQAQEFGLGGVPRSPAAAARSYEQAAASGNPWASWRLATLAERGAAPGGRRRALELSRQAAEAGHAPSAANLGLAYLEGRGVSRDSTEAARWLTVAARGGVPEAQYALGQMVFRGDGVARSPYDALQWMRRAGDGGNVRAQRAVGRLYMTGLEEMGQDLQEARSWLSRAAEQGDAQARRDLAEVDRALRDERRFAQELTLRREETRAAWAASAWSGWIAPPVWGWGMGSPVGPWGGPHDGGWANAPAFGRW